ncbi:endolytic transglycosylase MltG [Fusobacterium sp. MFO224]|uniref:endolytic transglycosylase MltG n=1 Tax=Fusobacterium sp. MFO224 TaxID=3378070 RepID=UPI003853924A
MEVLKKLKKIISVFFIFIILGIVFITYEVEKKVEYNQILEINKGDSVIKTIKKLNPSREFYFKAYLKLCNDGKDIKAGYYELKGEYSIVEIIKILQKGKDKIFKFTIQEGLTVQEVIEKLEKEKRIDQGKFKEELGTVNFPYMTPNENFEGYFYPNTYYFPEHVTEKEIIKTILDEFLKKFPPEKYPDKKDFYKKLILASIIEREAQVEGDKKLIASVFYNRMEKGMTLSSDATVNYVFDYKKKRILYKDLKVDSPYNTYIYKGLPPSPIGNPDKNSIDAAFNPSNTNYLFFVAKGDGAHYFSETYREHLDFQRKNKKK